MSDTTTRTVICPNEHCGGTIYEATYAFDANIENPTPIWRCCNCNRETPRLSRNRKSNGQKRWDVVDEIRKEWSTIDEALRKLVDAGAPSGCLLVHTSTFNWHLEQLTAKSKPSNRDLQYHSAKAREDMEKARQFVQSKQEAK